MSMMLKYLIFILLIIKIFSIQGQGGFTPNTNGVFNKVDINEPCPCDTTSSCEKGCCCDKDCLNFMLDNSFFDDNFECDPESSSSRIINSKLEYCEDYKKSIDDLYNPLILAFKILKRGFCLFRDNKKEKEEKEKNSQDEDKQDEENIIFNKNLMVPLALPSGMCLFDSYSIEEYQDYEVTCTYKKQDIINNIRNNFNLKDEDINRFELGNEVDDLTLKKVEIFRYGKDKNTTNTYYEKTNGDYQDFTFVIKNFEDENDYHKSGNPGYIKGKPILIGEKGEDNYIQKFKYDIVFPIDQISYHQSGSNTEYFYYDNYMDNKITFEDLIFYKYKQQSFLDSFTEDLNEFNFRPESSLYFGLFGNANSKYRNDWDHFSFADPDIKNAENIILLGSYIDYGLVNNTQFKIQDFEIRKQDNINNYFIMKFLKIDTENDWWYSPGPGFVIRVPKNWMYPFQIGTTTYRTKT